MENRDEQSTEMEIEENQATEMVTGDNESTEEEIARILVEFLEVAITSIIFLKRVYPAGAFERRRYMNAVVQIAREPQLRDYIHSSVSALVPFIEKGLVDRVAVVFCNKDDNVVVEQFVFKLRMNVSSGTKVEEADLEFALRALLIKLPVSESLTKPLPPDCRWEITAYFRMLPQVGTSDAADVWIPTDTKKLEQPPPVITPIKSMNSQPLSLQLYVEHPNPSDPKSRCA
ncbi:DNA polymerase zeta processivity subunit [Linum grandiflorum]